MANSVNRTNKNTPNNRGKLTEKEKFLLLRSVWLGREYKTSCNGRTI